ncbi:TKL protein kinase [Thecamonas trahens ATCC 50062]|uniref:TKL protein kinase n=1 Tax=Thecamonas trahens ATCC 50062 TaxID=461836 RepID=A0A0L0DAN6_THETB|nr:TKL protein kinase [Thecamonas trahens ATCC 50062]KNC49407.1 TKL protein kinase [Thecamonas trahens ATCC 50062]|eukprot:XP_013757831.1 TKL protein kinase [Thecamonas trahens ATCC 50062]
MAGFYSPLDQASMTVLSFDELGATFWTTYFPGVKTHASVELGGLFAALAVSLETEMTSGDKRALGLILDPHGSGSTSINDFACLLRWFGPFPKLIASLRGLLTDDYGASFFFGHLPGPEALGLVAASQPGTFLVRFSQSDAYHGGLAVTVVGADRNVRHWKGIRAVPGVGIVSVDPATNSPIVYATLIEFVRKGLAAMAAPLELHPAPGSPFVDIYRSLPASPPPPVPPSVVYHSSLDEAFSSLPTQSSPASRSTVEPVRSPSTSSWAPPTPPTTSPSPPAQPVPPSTSPTDGYTGWAPGSTAPVASSDPPPRRRSVSPFVAPANNSEPSPFATPRSRGPSPLATAAEASGYAKLPPLSRISPPPEYGSWSPPGAFSSPPVVAGQSASGDGYEHDISASSMVPLPAPGVSAYDAYQRYTPSAAPGSIPVVGGVLHFPGAGGSQPQPIQRQPKSPHYDIPQDLGPVAPPVLSTSPVRPSFADMQANRQVEQAALPQSKETTLTSRRKARKDRFAVLPTLALEPAGSADASSSSAAHTAVDVYSWRLGGHSSGNSPKPSRIHLPGAAAQHPSWLAAGQGHTVVLTGTETGWGWGSNSYGQACIAGPRTDFAEAPLPLETAGALDDGEVIVAADAGDAHTMLLTSRGRALAVGHGADGRLGTGSNKLARKPTPVAAPTADIAAVAAAGGCSGALTSSGTALVWGDNRYGQLGLGADVPTAVGAPTTPPGLESVKVVKLCFGRTHAMFLSSDGSLWVAGTGYSGQLGLGTHRRADVPIQVPATAFASTAGDRTELVDIAAGDGHALALTVDGRVFVWGTGSGLDGVAAPTSPALYAPAALDGVRVLSIAAKFGTSLLVTDAGVWNGRQLLFASPSTVVLSVAVSEEVAVALVTQLQIAASAGASSTSAGLLPDAESYWATGELPCSTCLAELARGGAVFADANPASAEYALVVDLASDKELLALGRAAKRAHHASVSASSAVALRKVARETVRRLALMASDALGGAELSGAQTPGAGLCGQVLLGSLKTGGMRARTLLFKVLADFAGVPCALLRGVGEQCWNVASLPGGDVVVDVLVDVASIYPVGSSEATAYCVGEMREFHAALRASRTGPAPAHLGFDVSSVTMRVPVGRGGFGLVERGVWRGMAVAIKTLDASLASDPHAAAEFEDEVWLLSQAQHPNVVRFVGACAERLVLVTEFCGRGSLWDVLHEQPISLSWGYRLLFAAGAAAGILYLHDHASPRIIHRDVKSLNLLVTDKWCIKVADFGLARVKTRHAVLTGRRIGSFQWMAPELFEAGTPYTEAVDVYGFGVVLWELATRHIPFEGLAPIDAIELIVSGARPPLDPQASAYWPPGLADLIALCWHPDPASRPRMAVVFTELQRIREAIQSRPDTL